MINENQVTVNSLKKLLDLLSTNGCGDIAVYLGKDTPLLEGAICCDHMNRKLLFHNTYYDKEIVDAAREFKDTINLAIQDYICKCYRAGRFIKCGESSILEDKED